MTISLRWIPPALAAGLVTATIAAGCSTSDDGPKGPAGALEEATGAAWIVVTDPASGAVTYAAPRRGPYALPDAGAADRSTLAFLAAHRALFKMHDPASELVLEANDVAEDGSRHLLFRQRAGALPVHPATWSAHFDAPGRLVSMTGRYAVDAHVVAARAPAVLADAASASAKSAVLARAGTPGDAVAGSAELEVLALRQGPPVLAWRLPVAHRAATFDVHVDATTGAVLRVDDQVAERAGSALPPQSYPPYSVDAPPVAFHYSDDDPARLDVRTPDGTRIRVVSFRDGLAFDSKSGFGPAHDGAPAIAATTAEPWSDPSRPQGAATAAEANAETVLAYLAGHAPRGAPWRSYDGDGGTVRMFLGDNRDGPTVAFYMYAGDTLHFSDGNESTGEWALAGSLETVAHELGHGVTHHAAGLGGAGDARAINEHLSDVLAALVTHRLRTDGKEFVFSEDDNVKGTPYRSMIQPGSPDIRKQTASHVDEMTDEEHQRSGVPSHAFYLYVHGGTHARTRIKVPCGIGFEAADRLYWRLETGRLLNADETLDDLAVHTLDAARQLAINTTPIACAWVAVGVLTKDAAKTTWDATCEEDADAGAADAGDNLLVTQPAQLVECPASLAGPGVSLTQ